MRVMQKKQKGKVMACAAKIEQKEHPWATPTIAMRIATDHGEGDYPQCIMTVRERRK